ncbi:CotY/CotZ family spore coat protein [Lederbergia citri]|uniref:Uncharacterized protein n=1 Tax=Lederbergia citri TaxID=2833580 RepID=A0A942TBN2_9BACI|nr:CotY/CotZ family spore coat protein [Lederbergia citri]MBS4194891.1 hypothetical protein [Lederbergia citri]
MKQIICNALIELKSLQDLLTESSSKYFGSKLSDLVGVDTIPFIMYTNEGVLNRMGKDKTKDEETFVTNFFRIESIDQKRYEVQVSLLRPLDIKGKDTLSIIDLIKLKKTNTFTTIDLSNIHGIQPLDVDYVKRKVIVEPKY